VNITPDNTQHNDKLSHTYQSNNSIIIAGLLGMETDFWLLKQVSLTEIT